MKKLFLLPLAALLCWGCSKEAIQGGEPGMTGQNAADQYVVGIGFYGTTSNPFGDAKVNGKDITTVSPNGTVSVVAYPQDGYQVSYWLKNNAQPPLSTSLPRPSYMSVHQGESSFTETITRETWYEPVFEQIIQNEYITIQFSNMVDRTTVETGNSYLTYEDQYGQSHTMSLDELGSNTLEVRNGSNITIHMGAVLKVSGDIVYCAIRKNSADILANFTGNNPVIGDITISDLQDWDVIDIWAGAEDFSGGELGR